MAAFWPIGTAQIIRIVSYQIRKKVQILAFLHVICERIVSCPPPEKQMTEIKGEGMIAGYCPPSKCTRSTSHLWSGFLVKSPPIFHISPPPPPPGVYISRCKIQVCRAIWRCHISFSLWSMHQFGSPKPSETTVIQFCYESN